MVPGFYLKNEVEKDDIIKFCSEQFQISSDLFDVVDIIDKNEFTKDKKTYGIKFKKSNLSIGSIEDLIYQRDCSDSICTKAFESLQTISKKLTEAENEIKSFNIDMNKKFEETKKELVNDNKKLKELLASQIEFSDNFRKNTEKTLNKIKEEFQTIVQELETMREKSDKSKPTTQRDLTINTYKKFNGGSSTGIPGITTSSFIEKK